MASLPAAAATSPSTSPSTTLAVPFSFQPPPAAAAAAAAHSTARSSPAASFESAVTVRTATGGGGGSGAAGVAPLPSLPSPAKTSLHDKATPTTNPTRHIGGPDMTLQLPPPLPHAGDGHVHHRHEHDGHDDDHRDHHDLRGGEDGHDSDEEEADPVPVASGFVVFLPQQPPTPSTSSASTLPPKPKPSFLLTKHKPPPTPATPATAQSPIQIYYELHGTGTERLCLLTGLSASCSAWYSTITRLLRSRPNLAILAIDNRGAGASSTDDSLEPFSIRDLASDCERVLDHVGWTADVNLVGLSMGGMVALELLLLPNSRRRFRAAVLISTHAGRAVPTWTSIKHAFRTRAGQKRLPDDVDVFWKVKIMYPKPWLEQPAIARGRASPMGSSRGSSREAAGGGGSSRTSARAPSERDASVGPRGSLRDGSNGSVAGEARSLGAWEADASSVEGSPRGRRPYSRSDDGASRITNRDVVTEHFTRLVQTKGRQPQPAFLKQAKAILHHHVSSARLRAIGELGIPVHIVAGTDDQIVRLDATVKIHRKIPGSKLTVIKGAGHGIKDEAPDRLDQVFAETFGWL